MFSIVNSFFLRYDHAAQDYYNPVVRGKVGELWVLTTQGFGVHFVYETLVADATPVDYAVIALHCSIFEQLTMKGENSSLGMTI